MKRALVTGGCGFIGSNLVKELVKNNWIVDVVDNMSNGRLESLSDLNTRVLINSSFIGPYIKNKERDNSEVLIIQDDFASLHMLNHIANKNYDVVFHQAALPRVSFSVEYPTMTTVHNITNTVGLFEACAKNVSRVVFASSSSVYGGATVMPTKELSEVNPKSPYAWQKSAIETFAKICWDLYELDIACLRYFNVFGPGQYGDSPYSTAVSAWCHATKEGLPLRSDGDGTQSRDMCYVDNVVSANILAGLHDGLFKGESYNIACGDMTTNNEILDYFKNNYTVEVKNAPWRPGDVMHTLADVSKAYNDFGYKPIVRFWEGLDRTTKWWNL
jgi:nucleoside-diphosphate-sugar epimerase